MITPIEIQNKAFKSGGLGYDKKDVDNFMSELLESYEALYREKMEMHDRMNVLNEGLQYYKTIEKTLQKALVLAERTAEETKGNAMKNALLIEQEAVSKANVILADAKQELEQIRKQTIELVRQYDMYKARFKSLVAAQTELLDSQSFSVNLDQLSMFENMPDSVETPVGIYKDTKGQMPENPLDSLSGDDIEIINLDEE
ncbi:MAG: DivIVA domain-containing protein [Lachnospiraceae bacterium]|nr:DivIVA domain-containing protein [Lachnospiraceae bacterium]